MSTPDELREWAINRFHDSSMGRVELLAFAAAWETLTDIAANRGMALDVRDRRIAELEADLAKLRAAEWRAIESAPKDGTLILLGRSKGVWVGKYLPMFQSGYKPECPWQSMLLNHDHMAERYGEPTHWMPLPAAPATDEKEGSCERHLEV